MTEDTAPTVEPVVPAPAPETPAPETQETPAMATFVEDAQTGVIDKAPVQSHPDTIQMQPEDPALVPEEVTQPGNETPPASEAQVEPVPVEPAPVASRAPKADEINAEMAAGAARVHEHEDRERMLAGKRASEVSEEKQVSDATEANKDL